MCACNKGKGDRKNSETRAERSQTLIELRSRRVHAFMSKLGNARSAQAPDDDPSWRWITSDKYWLQPIKKIPTRVQQPCAYTNSHSIEPVNYARNNHFVLFLFLHFRSVLFHIYHLISRSFVKALARKQYKYARKSSSTVVNCPCSHLRAVCSIRL